MFRINFSFLIAACLMLFTSCRQKPRAMDTFLSEKTKKDTALQVNSNRTMSVYLGANNKVLYYLGDIKKPIEGPTVTSYGKDSLPKVLTENALKFKNDTDALIVLIKASDKSTYKNMVTTLDILKQCNIKSYGFVPISPQEVDLLKKQNAY